MTSHAATLLLRIAFSFVVPTGDAPYVSCLFYVSCVVCLRQSFVCWQGTAELREAFKKPGVILELCNVVVSSSDPQIRQYAAVLLRKRLSKSKHWSKLSAEEKNS